MGWLRRLTGPGATSGETGSGTPDAIDRDLLALLEAHGLPAFERQLRFAELVADRAWRLDQEGGRLLMGDDLAFPAQTLGFDLGGQRHVAVELGGPRHRGVAHVLGPGGAGDR